MHRDAYHHLLSDQAAHSGDIHIVLPHMYAVGVAAEGKRDIVIDEKGHAIPLAERKDFLGFPEKPLLIQLLFAELDAGHAAPKC